MCKVTRDEVGKRRSKGPGLSPQHTILPLLDPQCLHSFRNPHVPYSDVKPGFQVRRRHMFFVFCFFFTVARQALLSLTVHELRLRLVNI